MPPRHKIGDILCRPSRGSNINALLGFLLLVLSTGFLYVLLVASQTHKYSQSISMSGPDAELLSSKGIEVVPYDSWKTHATPNSSGSFISPHEGTSYTKAANPGRNLKTNTKKILCKRLSGARQRLALDRTFESVGNKYSQSSSMTGPDAELLSSKRIEDVPYDSWKTHATTPNPSGSFISPHEATSYTKAANPGRNLNTNTKKILRKRLRGARQRFALDTTFESVGNLVGKNVEGGEKGFPNSFSLQESLLSFSSQKRITQPVLTDTTAVSEASQKSHTDLREAQETVKYSQTEGGKLALKSHDWKPLKGHIDQIKWNAYRSDLGDSHGLPLILHHGNRDEWRARKRYLADERDTRAFFEFMKPDFNFGASFKLYNFLIERSLSDQEIWWSELQYRDLQRRCDMDYDDINLTIQIGDLIEPYISGKKISSKELSQVRNRYFDLFQSFKQSEKLYHKKWSIGLGKRWLKKRFSEISEGEPCYRSLIKALSSESHPHEWKESFEKMSQNLQATQWAPSSMKFAWLDLGFDVDEMEELICVLEAYKTRNVKAAYRQIRQASQVAKMGKPPALPLVYSAENMIGRFVNLHRSLSDQSKKRRLMLRWISENVFDRDEIYESILNIGKYTANSGFERFRFDILLANHRFFRIIRNSTRSIFKRFRDLFGLKKIKSIFKKLTFRK